MVCIASALTILFLIELLFAVVYGDIVNVNVNRNIDISTSIVRIKTTIQASGVNDSYVLCYPSFLSKNLAYLSVALHNENKTKTTHLVNITSPLIKNANTNTTASYAYVEIEMFEPNPTFTVNSVFTDYIFAFPYEIEQHERQYVLYDDNIYMSSVYKTIRQKTVLTLPKPRHASHVLSYTKTTEPFALKGNVLSYGAYTDIEPQEVKRTVTVTVTVTVFVFVTIYIYDYVQVTITMPH